MQLMPRRLQNDGKKIWNKRGFGAPQPTKGRMEVQRFLCIDTKKNVWGLNEGRIACLCTFQVKQVFDLRDLFGFEKK